MIVIRVLTKVRKEAIVAYFKVVSQHFPGGTEERNDKPQCLSRDADWVAHRHMSECRSLRQFFDESFLRS
jgi:hypothetical protein